MNFQPPDRFREPGQIQWACLDPVGPHLRPQRSTGARLNGVRYEMRVHEFLGARYNPILLGPVYSQGMWIKFIHGNSGQRQYAQPDGLIIDFRRSFITIVEIKLKHTIDAWWWLRRLYEPLIRHLFGSQWRYAVCEVVRWFDKQVAFPEPYRMTPDPAGLYANDFGVFIFNRV